MFPDCPYSLKDLMHFDGGHVCSEFMRLIRHYKSMFSFTSLGADIDNSVNVGTAPYVFKMHGTVYHRIGSLMPQEDGVPKFSQLYIIDSADELRYRMNIFGEEGAGLGEPDPFIV